MIITSDDQQRIILGKAIKRNNRPDHPSTVVAEHHTSMTAPALFPDAFKYRFTVPYLGCSLSTDSSLKRKFNDIECPVELVSSKLYIMEKAPINNPKAKTKRLM